MSKNIDPQLRTIGGYLAISRDAFYSIPEYQRAYSWQKTQCDKLWSDILDYSRSNKDDHFFFGTVILSCEKDDAGNDDKRLVLIDGQQRTTTFILLLKALLIRINETIPTMPENDDSEMLLESLKSQRQKIISILYQVEDKYVKRTPNNEEDAKIYSQFRMVENKSINESTERKKELEIILKATDFDEAEHRVAKIPKKQKDNKYTNFFRNFKFFYEQISKMHDSQLNDIVEVILDDCEIIEIKSWQVKQAIEMFNSLNSDGLPLEDADIISAKLYAAASVDEIDEIKDSWRQLKDIAGALSEKKIIKSLDTILTQYMYYRRAKNGITDVTMEGLRKYYTENDKSIIENPKTTCEDLLSIARAWEKVADYPDIQLLSKFNENAKTFLGNYLFRIGLDRISESSISPVVESLQRLFTVLELSDEGYSSKNFKMFLFEENTRLVDEHTTAEEIKQDFSSHINSVWNKKEDSKEEMYDRIVEYDGNALVYLNEFLVAKEKGVTINFNDADVEHIMPGSGKDKQVIRMDAGMESKEEFEDYLNKLGNKIVLEYPINRGIGDEWFRTKICTKLEDKTGYIDSKYPIANILVDTYRNNPKPYWKKEDIEKATAKAGVRIRDFIFS